MAWIWAFEKMQRKAAQKKRPVHTGRLPLPALFPHAGSRKAARRLLPVPSRGRRAAAMEETAMTAMQSPGFSFKKELRAAGPEAFIWRYIRRQAVCKRS
jgi:hypothetical protein